MTMEAVGFIVSILIGATMGTIIGNVFMGLVIALMDMIAPEPPPKKSLSDKTLKNYRK